MAELVFDIERPNRDVFENVVRGCSGIVERQLGVAANEVVAILAETTGRELHEHEDLAAYVIRAVSGLRARGERRARALDAARRGAQVAEALGAIGSGDFRRMLTEAWNIEGTTTSVDVVVGRFKQLGIDGERVCWAVITKESLNHILLVRREANRIARMWPDRSADDLVGYGWRGLRLALRSYNPETAWFSTYACPKIRGSIRDGVRNEHHLPKRLNTFVNKVEQARDDLATSLGRHPTHSEIAARLEIEVEQVQALATYAAPTSLDGTDTETGFQLAGGTNVEDDALALLRAERVRDALAELSADEAEAVQLLVMDQLPMREVRALTGASPKQLRARRDRALALLRGELGEFADDTEA